MTYAQQAGYWHQAGRHQALYTQLVARFADQDESPVGSARYLLNSTWSAYVDLHHHQGENTSTAFRDLLDTLRLDLIHERFHPDDAAQFQCDIEDLEEHVDASMTDEDAAPPSSASLSGVMERMMDRAILHCHQVKDPLLIGG